MQFGQTPGSGRVQKNAYGPGATGRPKGRSTSTKPVFVPTAKAAGTPEVMQKARELMDTYGSSELPTGLMPRWLLNKKNANISKGMTKG